MGGITCMRIFKTPITFLCVILITLSCKSTDRPICCELDDRYTTNYDTLVVPENTEQYMYYKSNQTYSRYAVACYTARVEAKTKIAQQIVDSYNHFIDDISDQNPFDDNLELYESSLKSIIQESLVDSSFSIFDRKYWLSIDDKTTCSTIMQFDKFIYLNEINNNFESDSLLSVDLNKDRFLEFYRQLLMNY
jgi:hypothetical protein